MLDFGSKTRKPQGSGNNSIILTGYQLLFRHYLFYSTSVVILSSPLYRLKLGSEKGVGAQTQECLNPKFNLLFNTVLFCFVFNGKNP